MTDIVDVLSFKLTTARSQVERHVLTRARDEIVTLRERLLGQTSAQHTEPVQEQYELPWTS